MNETTEPFGEVLITSTKDISLAYPELFTQCNVDSLPFLIEKKVDKVECSQEPRLVLTPSGIVAISLQKNNEFVWNDYNNEQYLKLLEEANKSIRLINEEEGKGEKPYSTIEKKIDDKVFSIECFPYNSVKASKNLMKLIEDKMQKYIHSTI